MKGAIADNEGQQTCSAQLRSRRVTDEDAYASVLINEKAMLLQGISTCTIDFEKFVAETIRISVAPEVDWPVESIQLDPHPTQAVRPATRGVVDGFYLPDEQ